MYRIVGCCGTNGEAQLLLQLLLVQLLNYICPNMSTSTNLHIKWWSDENTFTVLARLTDRSIWSRKDTVIIFYPTNVNKDIVTIFLP